MKGYIYCKECGDEIDLLDDVEYCKKKEDGNLPSLCNKCFAKKIDLNDIFHDIFN